MRSRDRGLVLIRRRVTGISTTPPKEGRRSEEIGRREWGSVSPAMGNDRVRWRVIFHPNSPELGWTCSRPWFWRVSPESGRSCKLLWNKKLLRESSFLLSHGRSYDVRVVRVIRARFRSFVSDNPPRSPSNDPISLRRFALPSICTSSSSAQAIIRKKSNWGFDWITLLPYPFMWAVR